MRKGDAKNISDFCVRYGVLPELAWTLIKDIEDEHLFNQEEMGLFLEGLVTNNGDSWVDTATISAEYVIAHRQLRLL